MRNRSINRAAYPVGILPYFVCYYMCSATYSTYYSNYLVAQGIDKGDIGSIMALSPIIALLVQPFWGAAGDRMKLKNTVLAILTGGTALVLFAGGFVNSTLYAYAVVCSYSFFCTSISPMMETIALEALEPGHYNFGPVRMTGTIAYAITAPIIGSIIANNYQLAPFFAALFMGLGLIAILFMPRVEGHQHGKREKVSVMRLLQNRQLVLMLCFSIVLMLGMSYYNTYFSLYLQELGADSAVLGVSYFLSAAGEIPFLLVGDKLFKKLGVGRLLLISAAAMALRMLLIGASTNITFVLLTQLLHGLCYIVMSFAMAKFVNLIVPDELKASGQMLLNVVGFGLARAVGAWISGVLVKIVGMRMPFLYSAGVCALGLVVFGVIILRSPELKNAGREEHA